MEAYGIGRRRQDGNVDGRGQDGHGQRTGNNEEKTDKTHNGRCGSWRSWWSGRVGVLAVQWIVEATAKMISDQWWPSENADSVGTLTCAKLVADAHHQGHVLEGTGKRYG